ncbi:hypothetical protein GCM10027422_33560 [Hymenobacter arcticus]
MELGSSEHLLVSGSSIYELMKKILLISLTLGLPYAVKAQTTPPAGDLRQLVETMQKVVKPSISQPLPPRSTSALASFPLPLVFNGSPAPLDSLNRYTLSQVASVTLNKSEANTAIYGLSGSWGIIEVTLKKRASK